MNKGIREWREQGMEFGFRGYGYGKYANGIPCSYQFRNKKGGVR